VNDDTSRAAGAERVVARPWCRHPECAGAGV